MDAATAHEMLSGTLTQLGIEVVSGTDTTFGGFPLTLETASGEAVTIKMMVPGMLSCLDEQRIGVAILDSLGHVSSVWGVAEGLTHFEIGKTILETPIAGLAEACSDGNDVNLYLEGHRYFAAPVHPVTIPDTEIFIPSEVFVLVIRAEEEEYANRQLKHSERIAGALKRLGKVMAIEAGPARLCVAAAHEISSAADLAAVIIWTADETGHLLKLSASVGINRSGQAALNDLNAVDGSACLAELVASIKKHLLIEDLNSHMLSAELEGTVCYLKPKGLALFPLVSTHKLVGVVELIGKFEDKYFEENYELFETFAEQVTLALNAAQLYESAEKRASHDALTGLANHKSMHEFLHSRTAEADRSSTSVGVIMIDVDHFRSFNEEEGHEAGDAVLRLVASTLKSCVRPYDLAARYGGEEFTIIMPGATRESVMMIAERIRAQIEQRGFATASGRDRHLTASLGVALFPQTSTDAESILKAADEALYQAKRGGRNKVVFFEGVFERVTVHSTLELDLDRWLIQDLRTVGEHLLQAVSNEIEYFGDRLGLSALQIEIIKIVMVLVPSYRKFLSDGSATQIQEFETAAEMRLLLPTLQMLEERFDGKGPRRVVGARIPLLARIVHVLLALGEAGATPFINDSGAFDPELVSMLADLPSAA